MHKRLIVALPLALIGALWFYYLSLPWPILLRQRNPERTSFMDQRLADARKGGDRLALRHDWVPLGRISRHLRRAVIAAEDGRFYDHNGIDWQALGQELRYRGDADFSWLSATDLASVLGAVNYYRSHRDRIRGRSTITQQLAKNLYFSERRSLGRKFGEFVVARRLEWFLSKDRILELYLNVVEWGPGVFGAEAAARYYFGKSASKLTAEQAAALAATLPHPLTSNPKLRPSRMAWRKRMILARMGGSGPVQTVPLEPPRPPTDSLAPPDSTPPDTIAIDTLRSDTLPRVPPDTVRRDTLPVQADTVRRDTLPAPSTLRSMAISSAN